MKLFCNAHRNQVVGATTSSQFSAPAALFSLQLKFSNLGRTREIKLENNCIPRNYLTIVDRVGMHRLSST